MSELTLFFVCLFVIVCIVFVFVNCISCIIGVLLKNTVGVLQLLNFRRNIFV